jgi:ATP-dependent protease ClpP protease subunit
MKKVISSKDEDVMSAVHLKKIPLYTMPIIHKHDVYLSGEIGPPEDYVDVIQTLRHASQNDLIIFHINSPGGDIHTALQLIEAMEESSANTVAIVAGVCASAATMIFLTCQTWEVGDHATFMIHTYSGGAIGKGNEIHDQILFAKSWSEKLIRDTYKDFLTSAEIEAVLKGADVWLNADDVGKRLEKRIKKLEADAKSSAKESKKKDTVEKKPKTEEVKLVESTN